MSSLSVVTSLDTNITTVTSLSVTSANITPPIFSLITAFVQTNVSSGTAPTPTASGGGLTWTQVTTVLQANSLGRLTVFSANAGPTLQTFAVTFTVGTASFFAWSMPGIVAAESFLGTNGVIQSATALSLTTAVSVTLAAFSGIDNLTLLGTSMNTNATLTRKTGYTVIGQTSTASRSIACEYILSNDTNPTATWSAGTNNTAAAMEIAASHFTYTTVYPPLLAQ